MLLNFLKIKVFIVVGNVDRPRRVEHSGSNIEVVSQTGGFLTPLDNENTYQSEFDNDEYEENHQTESRFSMDDELDNSLDLEGENPYR